MPGASDRERQLCDGRLILLRQMPQFTDWYFSEKGGLMLTSHNRDLYFALQDLVEAVGSKPDWQADRIGKPKEAFQAIVARLGLAGAQDLVKLLDRVKVSEWPPSDLVEVASGWRKDVVVLANRWEESTRENALPCCSRQPACSARA